LNENICRHEFLSFGFDELVFRGQLRMEVLNAWSPVGADSSLCKLANGHVQAALKGFI
jgi:hypothetical protein